MAFSNIILLGVIILSFIIILLAEIKSKHFFSSFFLTFFSGTGALALLYILSAFTSLYVPFNLFTVCVSGLSGIPGVIALLLTAITV